MSFLSAIITGMALGSMYGLLALFMVGCVYAFMKWYRLVTLGVSFISIRDNLDLSTPSGRLMFQIIGAMAEFERALIQERVRAGLRNARAKGKLLGRPRMVVDPSQIARLRSQGRSVREIAEQLGYSRSLVHKTLANR